MFGCKRIFSDFIESQTDFCVVDAYPFGYLVLEWYDENIGFNNQTFFHRASDLFDYLLNSWKRITVYSYTRDDGKMNIMSYWNSSQQKSRKKSICRNSVILWNTRMFRCCGRVQSFDSIG